jgi:hypothetical protein
MLLFSMGEKDLSTQTGAQNFYLIIFHLWLREALPGLVQTTHPL